MDGDKYPVESDRRRFVKGVVGGAALSTVGTTMAAAVNTLTSSGGFGGGGTTFYGVENIAGPAPRGMPMIPVEIVERDGEQVLKGRWPANYNEKKRIAEEKIADVTYSSAWFQYCGVQTYPGTDPKADQDNVFRYAESSKYEWQANDVSAGDLVKVSDFSDYEDWSNSYSKGGRGKPAIGTWRSQGMGGEETMPVQILRSPIIEEMANSGGNPWIAEATDSGFMAYLNKCTHFCCVPGFATSDYQNADGKTYCQCHQSVYDPFSIVKKTFVALPRPAED